jgi:hydroxymethylpyrimidine/phosphomethylpyrimidine kinase
VSPSTDKPRAVALTIAGSDPSGGAGIQADLKTFHQFGVYGEAVITLLTVQNTVRVSAVELVGPDLIVSQIEAVIEDIPPRAAKTGALGSAQAVEAVARAARQFAFPLVVDPVIISKHGSLLLLPDAVHALKDYLLPCAALVTPNLPEAQALTGETDPRRAAEALLKLGARAALIKGGHAQNNANDYLLDGHGWLELPAPRIDTPHTHGTGCTYSAAITASLALGLNLRQSVQKAKAFIHAAIAAAPGLGHGSGPVNHNVPEPRT